MAEGFTVLDAMTDAKVFGPIFGGESFAAAGRLLRHQAGR